MLCDHSCHKSDIKQSVSGIAVLRHFERKTWRNETSVFKGKRITWLTTTRFSRRKDEQGRCKKVEEGPVATLTWIRLSTKDMFFSRCSSYADRRASITSFMYGSNMEITEVMKELYSSYKSSRMTLM